VLRPAAQAGARGLDDSSCIKCAIEDLADQEDPEVASLLADLLAYPSEHFGDFLLGSQGRSGTSIMTMDCIAALQRIRATAAIPAFDAVVTSWAGEPN